MSRFLLGIGVVAAAVGGYAVATLQDDSRELESRRINYTDRGRICLEAATMLRNGDVDGAVAFLEIKALHSIRGVPMGEAYSELPEKSQLLLSNALVYETQVADVEFAVDRLVSHVPTDRSKLTEAMQRLRSSE